jgi:predicted DsbA family dithiol-disulfide isomerase
LNIEVGFDFICPWCLIGKRHLQQALAQLRTERPDVTVRLRWQGVQLLPTVPPQGWPFEDFYRQRLGGEAAMRQRQAMVLRAADAAGVRIDYAAIGVMPNTADAHRLLAWAGRQGGQGGEDCTARRDDLLERLLRAYFEDGDDIGNPVVLLAHGEQAGFERAAMRAQLRGAGVPYRADSPGAGVGGVPSFSINGGWPLTGAQPPEVLLDAMLKSLTAQSSHAEPAS